MSTVYLCSFESMSQAIRAVRCDAPGVPNFPRISASAAFISCAFPRRVTISLTSAAIRFRVGLRLDQFGDDGRVRR